jgi:hypothetical protein
MALVDLVRDRTGDNHAVDAKRIIPNAVMARSVVAPALRRFTFDRPRERVAALDGDGATFRWDAVTGLPGWVDGYSRVRWVQYPYAATDPAVTRLEEGDDWVVLRGATGDTVLQLATPPGAGTGNLLVSYTAGYGSETDVAPDDVDALAALATSIACDLIAAYYANTVKSEGNYDPATSRELSQIWADRANDWMGRYRGALGRGGDTDARAGAGGGGAATVSSRAVLFADLDTTDGVGGGWLTHRGRRF